MELGQRIKNARLEAGLSQRQLCGDVITRNMLSQIENGSARPSMDTLGYLAGQLGKPVSYFLEEDAVVSPNQAVMERARKAYAAGEFEAVAEILGDYRENDPTFDWEMGLLKQISQLELAERAVAQGRLPYARHLLEQMEQTPYGVLLESRRALLRAKLEPGTALPNVDEVLILKARAALQAGEPSRAAAYLNAAEEQEDPRWQYLRGEACFALGQYREAVEYYTKAEESDPQAVIPKLEQCYSKLEDYKMAYLYACKQR